MVCLADVVRDVKAVSSRWVHEEIGERAFAWQEGYGAFTVSAPQRETVREYIARRFPNAKVARKIAQLHDVPTLKHLCLECNEIQDTVALRKRLDEAIQAQKR